MERRWGSGDKEWGIRGWQGRAHLRGLGDGKEAQRPRGQGGWAVKDPPPERMKACGGSGSIVPQRGRKRTLSLLCLVPRRG